MRIIEVEVDAPAPHIIDLAVQALREGAVIAYLTDTIYALGADVRLPEALERVYELKQRADDKALPVIVAELSMLAPWIAELPEAVVPLLETCWPGPLTIIFQATPAVSARLVAGSGKLAARVPGRALPRALSRALGAPIVATSANISGRPGATDVTALVEQFGKGISLILDSGPAELTTPSTIIDVTDQPPRLIRQGAVPVERVISLLGEIQQ